MMQPGLACADGTSHRWSEWRYDESAAGAVRECERCAAVVGRDGTVIAQPAARKASTPVGADASSDDANALLAALGGSTFTEELRGNLLDAARVADEALHRTRTVPQRADAMIARAAVHIMAGEIGKARPLLLETLAVHVTDDADRRVRALSHLLDAMHRQYNLMPDRSGSGAVEITAHWGGVSELLPLDAQWNATMRVANSDAAQFDAWLTYAFGSQLLPSRYMLDARRYSPSEQSLASVLQMATAGANQLRTFATSLERPAMGAWADWVAADMHRRAGDLDSAQTLLMRAQQAYAAAGDEGGVALCLMTRADWTCAPFSSPLSWNFAVVDSSGPSSGLSTPLESEEALGGSAVSYDEALQQFRAAGAPRGEAAIALRMGYLASLRDDWDAAFAHASTARDLFTAAGDQLNAQLAATHRLMAALSGAACPDDPLVLASTIGARGAV
ncbi:MAG TPA: hypothetical protein VE861_13405, partial [Gemmatimonadaceae bacterium]|nr:hypothetical protein [Gemmatimonadaceae bacterium]